MALWLEGIHFSLFDCVDWLITVGIIHAVEIFSPFKYSCLFKIKILLFSLCRCCILSLYFCFYFVITDMVSHTLILIIYSIH